MIIYVLKCLIFPVISLKCVLLTNGSKIVKTQCKRLYSIRESLVIVQSRSNLRYKQTPKATGQGQVNRASSPSDRTASSHLGRLENESALLKAVERSVASFFLNEK